MNRIDEIKDRLKRYQEDDDKFKWLPYEDHVQYLLSKLELAERALVDVVHMGRTDILYALKIAEARLTKLRE